MKILVSTNQYLHNIGKNNIAAACGFEVKDILVNLDERNFIDEIKI